MAQDTVIGVFGGSGLYEIEGIQDLKETRIDTPFGKPSDSYWTGMLENKKVVFLPRHGKGHKLTPSEVNYRANIYGMKKLGVQRILSISAVGSLKEEIKPGDIVIIDQFVDRTKSFRLCSFFGSGCVGHIPFADPICEDLASIAYNAAKEAKAKVHKGGTYVCIEGPQFSTRAESHLYRSWGMSVIGMTNLTEAKLAREAGLCYTTIALSTDYDCWKKEEEAVSADAVVEIIKKNVALAKQIIKFSIAKMKPPTCKCSSAAKYAILTDPTKIPHETKETLSLILE